MSENVYQAPESNLASASTETTTLSIKEILFSFKGRIPRKTYWYSVLGMILASFVLMFLVALLTGGNESAISVIMLILYIPLIWISLAIQVKRWHDRNKSGWWVLIGFVPLIGPIWALIENGFLAGDEAENRFGQPTSL
ncbi:DUF805 domain-containing protein [Pseudoalteromonas shioyasakiensis]|uniref:DUF805 domain-containing protein n=1 Tax=Pseudoalteromonas shioyasakiensis TaxID=1190813 RepID=A0ABT6TXM9_9GAMM|nr:MULTISPECIES: DUF805 domain-containing protein [Pseudoalteromonas]MDI4668670.1 DUF805 domain-containing protein [Pseudoalteromonas shioyasakiensis]MDI4673795.1 DUF805 domain-containing protein [Pseudoalteromonas shioyasakiensis]MDI4685656.1 DUF805 domain-containing protein [Pseudoalteromonas shioyasakiensis]MDI4703872.1 DUF805 domain-containing protein [Pseudoalteromonas shioyasakiensis]GKW53170.1 DUF805 domain-containing protein [Pseudoalteromonas sp. NCCP-2140]